MDKQVNNYSILSYLRGIEMANKPWDGRFSQKTDKLVDAFNASIGFDKRLYAYDIEGSIAHCKTLASANVITRSESFKMIKGLQEIKKEMDQGIFKPKEAHEDIHMYIEDRLTQKIGALGKKLHTARSRNDQVALDVRLYLRKEIDVVLKRLHQLSKVIVNLADKHIHVILPGYTHLQRAQPILLSHHFMAYYEMFSRDSERFEQCLKQTNVMPLGSAALAGTTYSIDRNYTAKLLKFPSISKNSLDAVSDRDFIIEFQSAVSICMMHLSRLSEELILWASSEFDFIEMPDAFATGSSIMPQKKNPDVAELVRGKTSRIFGNLMTILTLMKSLPLAYNKDMQEDKEPLFDSVDTINICLEITARLLPKIKINKNNMLNAASKGYLNATDFADYLVAKGVAFRDAHRVAGKVVKYALGKKKEIHELSITELQSFSDRITEDVFSLLTCEAIVNKRGSFGGTSVKRVKAAIRKEKKKLSR